MQFRGKRAEAVSDAVVVNDQDDALPQQTIKNGRQFKGLNLIFLKDIIMIFYSATTKATTKRWDLMKTRDDWCTTHLW